MDQSDELEEYLRGGSELSRRYEQEAAPAPPHVLDRRVLRLAREAEGLAQRSAPPHTVPPHIAPQRTRPQRTAPQRAAQRLAPRLQPLAFAACVLLSVALVLAMVFGPQTAKRAEDNAPRLLRVAARADVSPSVSLNHRAQLYGGDLPRPRAPAAWLADIAALRRAGRNSEADAEYRRFRSVYPGYSQAGSADHANGLVIGP